MNNTLQRPICYLCPMIYHVLNILQDFLYEDDCLKQIFDWLKIRYAIFKQIQTWSTSELFSLNSSFNAYYFLHLSI